ncbi:MAG: hypothetical protein GX275_03005, partial [Clostridiales bacterium]|nr:hypothetical protein [Clostridiales bacterium]
DKQSPQNVGTSLKLSAEATGQGTLQYRFVAYSGTYKEVIKDFSTSSLVSWTPKKAGTYNIYFVAKDSTGKTVQKVINNYVVKSAQVALNMTSYSVDKQSPQNVGTSLKLSAEATGQGTLQYRFVAYSGDYQEVIKDFSTSSTVAWTPKKAGTYNIYFVAKDSTGKTVQKVINSYVISESKKISLNNINTNINSPQDPNKNITIIAEASGNGVLSYRFWEYNTDGNWKIIKNYSNSNIAFWTPNEGGNYVIMVEVKDEQGNTDYKHISYKINDKATSFDESNGKIVYSGTWNMTTNSNHNNGSIKYTKSLGAKTSFKFSGTGIRIIAPTNNDRGIAKVTVDGVVYSVDMYSQTYKYKQNVFENLGLSKDKTHTITIECMGIKSGVSFGNIISLDSFEVLNGNII